MARLSGVRTLAVRFHDPVEEIVREAESEDAAVERQTTRPMLLVCYGHADASGVAA